MRRWQRWKYAHLRHVTFDWQALTNDFQHSAYKRIFCVFGGIILEDWSRFVLITGGTKKGHFWMQRIAETVGELLKGDWGRSRLITGGNISGHYCTSWETHPLSWNASFLDDGHRHTICLWIITLKLSPWRAWRNQINRNGSRAIFKIGLGVDGGRG